MAVEEVAVVEAAAVEAAAVVVASDIAGSPLGHPLELRPRLRPVWPIPARVFYRSPARPR